MKSCIGANWIFLPRRQECMLYIQCTVHPTFLCLELRTGEKTWNTIWISRPLVEHFRERKTQKNNKKIPISEKSWRKKNRQIKKYYQREGRTRGCIYSIIFSLPIGRHQRHLLTTEQVIYWGCRIRNTKIMNYSKISKNLSMNGK